MHRVDVRWSLSRYSSTGVLKKERVTVRDVITQERTRDNQTGCECYDEPESEAEARCIRAWRKSCEVLKNQEAESNENDRHQEIMSRSGGVLTTLFILSRLRKERFAESLIAIRELKQAKVK